MKTLQQILVLLYIVKPTGTTFSGNYTGIRPIKWNPLLFIILFVISIVVFIHEGGKAVAELFRETYKHKS